MSNDFRKLPKAFGHAFDGWDRGLKERNLRIHLLVTFLVLVASIIFRISTTELLIVILSIGAVISAELFNTAVEEVCNILNANLKLDYSETTMARDLSAGAVLAIVTAATFVGLIIFVPKILLLVL